MTQTSGNASPVWGIPGAGAAVPEDAPPAPPEGVPETGYWAVPVTTGIFDAQNIEIIDGVEAGTEVFQQVMYSEMY